METAAIVLTVDREKVEEFEAGFRQHELPTWVDFHEQGVLVGACLQRMDISSQPRSGAQQYLQVAPAMASGGETILQVGWGTALADSTYNRKRDFEETPEPAAHLWAQDVDPMVAETGELFVLHQHYATRSTTISASRC